jgi:hypothetical protein
MRFLIKVLKNLLPKESAKPVGRWSNEQCVVKINQRVDLSNEDHCGPCGQYILSKTETKNTDAAVQNKAKNSNM